MSLVTVKRNLEVGFEKGQNGALVCFEMGKA
jgi:hypothetical protein